MKYVFLGTIDRGWIEPEKARQRVEQAKSKADELSIRFETILYTQGYYDFVDVVDAPDPRTVLSFSIWYAKQGYGKITTMPAFGESEMLQAVAII